MHPVWDELLYHHLLFARRGYNNVLGSVALRNKLIDVENAIKVGFPTNHLYVGKGKESEYSNIFIQLANDDGTVTYDEIRNQLKK